MLDSYKIITVSHKDLNTEDLAHFICRYEDESTLAAKLLGLCTRFGQSEVLYLATCNRVIYLFYGITSLAQGQYLELLQEINPALKSQESQHLRRLVQYLQGEEAVRHLFEVCASIDSLVVGEREIFRQFREAYGLCHSLGVCGDAIRLLEKATVRAAKDVYTSTEIGAKPVSVVSLAIQEFLKRKLPKDARILLIGSGETNSTVGRFLKKHGYKDLIIFNRSLDNALALSNELNARAKHLTELGEYQEGFDAMFACTAAQDAVIHSSLFENINLGDHQKLIVDLSIPRNVSQTVASHTQVDYISIDSIRILAESNLRARSGNIAAARIILNGHLSDFKKMYRMRHVEKAFNALPQEIDKIRERALTQIYKDKLAALQPEARALIEEITSYMARKCVAAPIRLAKETVKD